MSMCNLSGLSDLFDVLICMNLISLTSASRRHRMAQYRGLVSPANCSASTKSSTHKRAAERPSALSFSPSTIPTHAIHR